MIESTRHDFAIRYFPYISLYCISNKQQDTPLVWVPYGTSGSIFDFLYFIAFLQMLYIARNCTEILQKHFLASKRYNFHLKRMRFISCFPAPCDVASFSDVLYRACQAFLPDSPQSIIFSAFFFFS